MIAFLLDTNMCIYLIKRQPAQTLVRLQSLDISTVGISSIPLSELEYGVSKSSKSEQNKMALVEFLAPLEILPYDDAASASYGSLRAFLESQGTPIGPLDTLIAAHALALGCTLVANNVREFSRVPNLTVENWVA